MKSIYDQDIVLLIHDCTTIIENDNKNFTRALHQLIEQTVNLRIILVLKLRYDIYLPKDQIKKMKDKE